MAGVKKFGRAASTEEHHIPQVASAVLVTTHIKHADAVA